MISKISIIIPTWNGKHLLEKHLPFILKAIENCSVLFELIIVDDCSNDGTAEYLKSNYPGVKIIRFDKNQRFAMANNAGAKLAEGEMLLFLNNDVEVTVGFLNPLLGHFDDPAVFAVGCNIKMRGVRKESGLTRGLFKRGFLQVEHSWEEYNKAVPILYASGSAFMCDRKRFLELGGFDSIYGPFYWEDVDLSYRAWKRGWKVLFEPQSVVYHMHQATNNTKNFSRFFLTMIKERNRYLFIWKNISQGKYLLLHFSWLPVSLFFKTVRFQIVKPLAFLMALMRLPRIVYSGIKDERHRSLCDAEILRRTKDILYYKKCYHREQRGGKERLKILYICAYLPLLGVSAGSARMFEIIKRLSTRHQVDVISYIIAEEFKYLEALKNVCNSVDTVERNYPWQKDRLNTIPTMMDEFYSKEMAMLIKRRLYEEDYDIVQFEYLHMSQYAPESYSGKLVLTEYQLHFLSRKRDFKYLSFSLKKIEAFFSSLKGMIYEINACRRFNAVITMTEHEKEILKQYLPYIGIEAVPLGVDTKFFQPGNGREQKTDIMYLGFFRHPPNVDAVLYFYNKIYPLIKKELPEVSFNIVGYDPPHEILRIQNDGIKVTGYVEDVRPYLEEAKVFVMPIRLGMGMRGKLFEAWAMEKPIVSTSTGCEGVEVEDGKDILIGDTPEEFARKTVMLIKNERFRKTIGENGRMKAVSKYNWDILTEKLEDIYKGLL